MSNAYGGMGSNDPRGQIQSIRSGGTPLGMSAGGNKFTVDSSDLVTLHTRLTKVVTDVTSLDAAVTKLTTSLGKASKAGAGILGGGGSSAGSGGSGLTAAVFGGQGVAGNQSGGTVNLTTASFGGGGQPRGTTTPAAVSFGRTLAAGAVAEVGATWAGQVNNAMTNFSTGGMPVDLMARQSNAVFGGSNLTQTGAMGAVASYTGVPALSQQDRAQAMATMMANPFLFAKQGSAKQKQLSQFLTATQKLNPLMGEAGAAQFANTLASGPALSLIQRYSGSSGGALLRPNSGSNPGGINDPTQVFKALIKTMTGGQNLTSAGLKGLSGNTSSWAIMNQNFGQGTQMNMTPQELLELRQFAAAGGNMGKATAAVSGSAASSNLVKTTAVSRLKQNTFEASVPGQNQANRYTADAANAANRGVTDMPWLVNAGAEGAKLVGVLTSLAAHGAEVAVMFKGITSMFGGKGGGGGGGLIGGATGGIVQAAGGLLGKVFGGGSSSGGMPSSIAVAAATGSPPTGGRNFAFGSDGSLMVELSATSLDALEATHASSGGGSRKTTKKHAAATSSKSKMGEWGDIIDKSHTPSQIIGNLLGGLLGKLGPYVGDLSDVGDPPTGATTTAGMTPAMQKGVGAMMAANPNLTISSGHRTSAQQSYLYAAKGGQGVARPGQSQHQAGKAADIGPPSQLGWVAKNASKFGLHTPAPTSEPWHVEAMGDPTSGPSNAVTGAQVVAGAEAFQGVPYVWGGESAKGFDCSGLVQYVFGKLGISLPRTTYTQVKMGTAVASLAQARAGDLLFYAGSDGTASNPGHVTIYIGNGKQIEAPYTGTVVRVDSVSASSIVAIRRVISGGAGSSVVQAAQATVGSPSTDASNHAGSASPVGLTNTFLSTVGGSWLDGDAMSGPTGGSGAGGGSMGSGSAAATVSGGTSTSSSTGTPATAGSLSSKAVYQLAVNAGLSARAAQIATAVADVESRFDPTAVDHDSNGTTDYGLWQINSIHGVGTNMFNPTTAAAKMASMTNKGTNWGPWAPDFGQSGYGGNPAIGGKVAQALSSLGYMGDPAVGAMGTSFSPTAAAMATGAPVSAGPSTSSGGMPTFRSAGGLQRSGGSISISMPLTVVGVSQADAVMLANMVVQQIEAQTGMKVLSTT